MRRREDDALRWTEWGPRVASVSAEAGDLIDWRGGHADDAAVAHRPRGEGRLGAEGGRSCTDDMAIGRREGAVGLGDEKEAAARQWMDAGARGGRVSGDGVQDPRGCPLGLALQMFAMMTPPRYRRQDVVAFEVVLRKWCGRKGGWGGGGA